MAKARKETTVKEADAAAAKVKRVNELHKLILEEAYALESGKQHSVQQMLAYVRQAKKVAPAAKAS